MSVLYTLGHGTLPSDTFALTLRAEGITVAADVRRFPASKRHPHFGAPAMQGWLGQAGIAYRGFVSLGGRREPRPDSPNVALRNTAFRGYADYMGSDEFRFAFDKLIALARAEPTAIFCAETLWWTCHRRFIADAAVLLAGLEVRHLTPASKGTHQPTPGVRVADGKLIYDGRAPSEAPLPGM